MTSNKTLQFEYAISKLLEWYSCVVPNWEKSVYAHFTRLASLKLLFLLSAIKDYRSEDKDLLSVFDNYCAMQYGPVEVDIYSAIVYKQTSFYNFGNYALTVKDTTQSFDGLSDIEKARIDRAIELLKEHNPSLITLRASQLVNITHKWDAWRSAMGLAELLGRGSEKMSVESIRSCIPFYE